MITSGLNAADDTTDCSGNLNSTKSTDGSAGILTDLTAGLKFFCQFRSRCLFFLQ